MYNRRTYYTPPFCCIPSDLLLILATEVAYKRLPRFPSRLYRLSILATPPTAQFAQLPYNMPEEGTTLTIRTKADTSTSSSNTNDPGTSIISSASGVTQAIASVHWIGPVPTDNATCVERGLSVFALYHVPEASEADCDKYSRERPDVRDALLLACGLTQATDVPSEQVSANETEQLEKALNEVERRATERQSTVMISDHGEPAYITIDELGSLYDDPVFEDTENDYKQHTYDPYLKAKVPIYLCVGSVHLPVT